MASPTLMKPLARGVVILLLVGYTMLLYCLSSTDDGVALVVSGRSARDDPAACFESVRQHRERRSDFLLPCASVRRRAESSAIGAEFQVVLLVVDASSDLAPLDDIPAGDLLFVAASADSMTSERCGVLASVVRRLVAAQRWTSVRVQAPLICPATAEVPTDTVADVVRKRRLFRDWSSHRAGGTEADAVQSLAVSTLRDATYVLESPLVPLAASAAAVGGKETATFTVARSIDILILPTNPAASVAMHRAMTNKSKSSSSVIPLAVEDSLSGTEEFLALWTAKFGVPLTLLVYTPQTARESHADAATNWTVTSVEWGRVVPDGNTRPEAGGFASFTTVVAFPRRGTSHLVLTVHPASGDAWPAYQLQDPIP